MKKWPLFLLGLFIVAPSHATLTAVGLDSSQYTSDFMIGSVVVSVIFPESNGQVDPNTETWTEDRKSQVLTKIMAGLDWWTHQNPNSPLTFTYVTQTVATKYEPITRPYYDESLWIPDIMSQLGYSGTRFASTKAYVNDLRQQYHTDWGFVIFVVDSLADSNGKFADGYFAYSYLGGPFTVMTYDNNGYGIANMDVVVAHETGHIFNALDEYAGASSPNSYSFGYFPTINGNHQYSSTANEPNSIMRGGIRWGLDRWVKDMVGWKDADTNGRDDILDRAPTLNLASQSNLSSDGGTGFNGTAHVNITPRQGNTNGYGFTIDTIAKVEYKLGDGTWGEADPIDGSFNGPDEAFNISIPANQKISARSVISASDLNIRVLTAYATYVGSLSSGTASADLSDAHVFPNPYKPNSNLGQTGVTFRGLTSGAKVQIFTPAGERIFEELADNTGDMAWSDIKNASSGIYYFLITDQNGNKKKGKIAVIK